MMSNGSIGTRQGSASDWIRMKKLTAVRNLAADINTVGSQAWEKNKMALSIPTTKYGQSLLIPRDVGISKIQRTASTWTDYRAAQYGDFITMSRRPNTTSVILTQERLCSCKVTKNVTNTDPNILYVTDLNGLSIGDAIVFTNILLQGTVIRNGVTFYIVAMNPDVSFPSISISLTPGGPIIDPITDGMDVTTDTIMARTHFLQTKVTGCKKCSVA